jgi:type I restriction enzyme S subunit
MILAHTFPVARIEREMAFNQDIKAVDTHDFIDSGFLLWWLRNHSREFLKTATSASHGSKRISTESLFSQPIPVPPREEQEAIAEALSDVDALLASIDAAIEKKRNVKTATMQRLLTGEERLPGFEGEWEPRQLGGLLDFQNGVNAGKEAYGRGIPFINVLEVVENTHIEVTDIPGRVDVPSETRNKYSVQSGDILFNRTSETREEVGLASTYIGDEPVLFGGFVIRGRPVGNELNQAYAGYALRAPSVRKQIISSGQGAIRSNIGQQRLAKVEIPLPSLDEQRAIAEVLSDMDAEIEAWETRRAKTEAVKTGMMQELLTGKTRLT